MQITLKVSGEPIRLSECVVDGNAKVASGNVNCEMGKIGNANAHASVQITQRTLTLGQLANWASDSLDT